MISEQTQKEILNEYRDKNREEFKKQIRKKIKEARSKGWWIACFYWENKLEKELANN
jgi:hypothetical protein